jgi:hypothetical protein
MTPSTPVVTLTQAIEKLRVTNAFPMFAVPPPSPEWEQMKLLTLEREWSLGPGNGAVSPAALSLARAILGKEEGQ